MKSPPPPPPTPAAFGELQRRTARPRAPPSSAPPSPPSRFSAPGLYCPLATTPPWLGFRAVLRRPVSGGPRCRWSTPWDFPIHHARCRQGQEGTLASSTSSPRMMPLLHQDRVLFDPTLKENHTEDLSLSVPTAEAPAQDEGNLLI
ncbi:uncharacterized protein [Triticum aestivum]|uniref:uncharacterized protein isoform X2 n=1 Tax=Triticum aestivum TaxID=4565 RepID=UPI001D0192F5|nr:uncharacterized protein LOC123039289 isoform X2 [Triticum aestivum]